MSIQAQARKQKIMHGQGGRKEASADMAQKVAKRATDAAAGTGSFGERVWHLIGHVAARVGGGDQ
eukprot:8438878-Lingulodinium_polyedra.AAC.1